MNFMKVLGVTGDLEAEIETLARVIREKEAKIAEIKGQKFEDLPELQGFNIDKLAFEVNNIKGFLKENISAADRGMSKLFAQFLT